MKNLKNQCQCYKSSEIIEKDAVIEDLKTIIGDLNKKVTDGATESSKIEEKMDKLEEERKFLIEDTNRKSDKKGLSCAKLRAA